MLHLTLDLLLRSVLVPAITVGSAYLTSLLYLRFDLQIATTLPCSILLGLLLGVLLTKLPSALSLLPSSDALVHYKNANFWPTTVICLLSFIILSVLAFRDVHYWGSVTIAEAISVLDAPERHLRDRTCRVFSPTRFSIDRARIGYHYKPAGNKSASSHTFIARLVEHQTNTPSELWLVQTIQYGDHSAGEQRRQQFLRDLDRIEASPAPILHLPPDTPSYAADALHSLGLTPNERTLFVAHLEDLDRTRSLATTKLHITIILTALAYLIVSLIITLYNAASISKGL